MYNTQEHIQISEAKHALPEGYILRDVSTIGYGYNFAIYKSEYQILKVRETDDVLCDGIVSVGEPLLESFNAYDENAANKTGRPSCVRAVFSRSEFLQLTPREIETKTRYADEPRE